MKPLDKPVTPHEEILLRYVDDKLDVDERLLVEQQLYDDSDDAQRIREWHAHNNALRQHYDPLVHTAVPERLLRAAKRASQRSPMRYAAAMGWLIIGALAGYLGAIFSKPGDEAVAAAGFARQAAVAYAIYVPEMRHPVEVGADQEDHLGKWLSKKLGNKLNIPHLGQQGFSLVGGRLLPSNNGPVALFMYEDGRGQRLTLYVRINKDAQVRETAFRFAQEGKVGVFYWLDDNLGYALSGEVDRNSLLNIARAVYQQLNP